MLPPTTTEPSAADVWQQIGFVEDSNWLTGQAGIGFGDVKLHVYSCVDVKLRVFGSGDVKIQMFCCGDIKSHRPIFGCGDVKLQVFGCINRNYMYVVVVTENRSESRSSCSSLVSATRIRAGSQPSAISPAIRLLAILPPPMKVSVVLSMYLTIQDETGAGQAASSTMRSSVQPLMSGSLCD